MSLASNVSKRIAVAVAALAGCGVPAAVARGALVISEVAPQTTAGTVTAINGDWWELTNTGPGSVNLLGYQWADTEDVLNGPTPQTNRFPSFTVTAGQSVIILEELSTDEAAWRTNWGAPGSLVIFGTDEMTPSPTPAGNTDTFSGLGNTNDGVFVYDAAGTLLDSYTYAANTRGRSFEKGRTGTDLGLSVAGENGAVTAANADVGSPGATVVPEPAALSLVGGLLGATLARRPRHPRGRSGR